jgi:hypothetical protein
MSCTLRRSHAARRRPFFAVSAFALALTGTALAIAAAPQGERTIYVSAVGQNGMPVMDLSAADFVVSEDNVAREVTKIDKATEPLYYAVLVDTSQGSGGTDQSNTTNLVQYMREALTGFVKVVLTAAPDSKIMLMEFGGAAQVRQDFTSDLALLEPMIPKMLPKASEPVLNDAIAEAAKLLTKVPSRRRVVVSVNREPTPEASRLEGKPLAEEVKKTGVSVWAISVRYGTRQDTNRDNILKGLAANTGGIRVTLGSPLQLADYLRSVAANTIVQYAVTFTRPDGPPAKMTTVKINRAGVTPLTLQWSGD